MKALRKIANGLSVSVAGLDEIVLVRPRPSPPPPTQTTVSSSASALLSAKDKDRAEFGDRQAECIDLMARAFSRMLWRDVDDLLHSLGELD